MQGKISGERRLTKEGGRSLSLLFWPGGLRRRLVFLERESLDPLSDTHAAGAAPPLGLPHPKTLKPRSPPLASLRWPLHVRQETVADV